MVETLDERRERMARARSFRKASVTTTITPEQEFLVRHQNQVQHTEEPITPGDTAVERGTVDHKRPGVVTMWKPRLDSHNRLQWYEQRQVSATSIGMLITQGWLAACPDCGGQHDNEPNSCPNRLPVKYRVCPVCGDKIYDNIADLRYEAEDEAGDPNAITSDPLENSTPETRTEFLLHVHLWNRHQRQAQMLGIPQLPEAMRDMIEGVKAL